MKPANLRGIRVVSLGVLTLMMLMPVTLPVTVLKGLVVERFEVSELLASLFMSINMVGAFIGAPLAGALSDRLGRRKMLVIVGLLLDAILLWSLSLPVSFPVFLGLRFLEGISHIVALSLVLALASDHGEGENRGSVMGAAGAGICLGVALGAPLGGILGRTDPYLPLQVGAGLSLLAAFMVCVLLREVKVKSSRPSLREIIRALAADRWLLLPISFAFVDRFTVGFFTATFSRFMDTVHDLEPSRIGILLAYFMLPFGLLSYVFGRLSQRISRSLLVCVGSLLYGIGTVSLGFWSLTALPYLMLFLGVTSAVMFVPSLVLTTDLSRPEVRGTAMGAFNAAGSLGFVLGPVTGAWISQTVAAQADWHSGYQMAFVVAGLSEICCVMVAFPLFLRLAREGRRI